MDKNKENKNNVNNVNNVTQNVNNKENKNVENKVMQNVNNNDNKNKVNNSKQNTNETKTKPSEKSEEEETKIREKNEEKETKYAYGQGLKLIPKINGYITYMIDIITKLPRTEKFNIGNEFKESMYRMLRYTEYLSKLDRKYGLDYINRVDAELDIQRNLLRIMKNNNWISINQFNFAMRNEIAEIGMMVGGLVKYYAKYNQKSV